MNSQCPVARDAGALVRLLHASYGPQGWWPLLPPGGGEPVYAAGRWREPRTAEEIFEIAVGAVLAQRVAWRNVVPALLRLAAAGALSPAALCSISTEELHAAIRSTGTYRRKAETLRALADWFRREGQDARTGARAAANLGGLSSIRGMGPETVDSIALYGYGVPRFIADAYARRILARVGAIPAEGDYDSVQKAIAPGFPESRELCDEGHALFVALGKRHCRPRPLCGGCPLAGECAYARASQPSEAKRGPEIGSIRPVRRRRRLPARRARGPNR
ncbi:MAG: hypothetical protein L0Z55_02230 [Planctomycetes bacterium]|nr:hypothetical protein [Planctomycetota bacterium]